MKKLIYLAMFSLILSSLAILPVKAETLTNYYREQGLTLPIVSERSVKATECGIKPYWGSANQNIRLLACLRLDSQLGGNVPASGVTWNLASPISTADTQITLIKVTDLRNNVIDPTDMPTKIYLTLEPTNTENTEGIVCPSSGYTSSTATFTGCTRGLKFSGNSETSVTNNKKQHPSGAIVVISNWGQFYNNFVDVDSAQTIGGNKTASGNWIFNNPVGFPAASTTVLSTLDNQFISKYHAETLVAGGFSYLNVSTTRGLSVDGLAPERVGINASSTQGMAFDANGKLYQKTTTGLSNDSNGIGIDYANNNTWTGTNTFNGTTTLATTTEWAGTALVNMFNSTSTYYSSSSATTSWVTITHNIGRIPSRVNFNSSCEDASKGSMSYGTSGQSTSSQSAIGVQTNGSTNAGIGYINYCGIGDANNVRIDVKLWSLNKTQALFKFTGGGIGEMDVYNSIIEFYP